MSVNVIDAGGLASIEPLIEAYPFKPYRNYRVLSRQRQNDVLRAELRAALEQPGAFGLLERDETSPLAAVVRPLPWDSAFFDLSMARLYLLRAEKVDLPVLHHTIAASMAESRSRGIRHLSVRIDVGDAETIQVLERRASG